MPEKETQLAVLESAAPQDNDPALLDELPTATGILASAPDQIKEALLAAFEIQALYNKDMDQVTIWATLTEATLAPPAPGWRHPPATPAPTEPALGHGIISHSGPAPLPAQCDIVPTAIAAKAGMAAAPIFDSEPPRKSRSSQLSGARA